MLDYRHYHLNCQPFVAAQSSVLNASAIAAADVSVALIFVELFWPCRFRLSVFSLSRLSHHGNEFNENSGNTRQKAHRYVGYHQKGSVGCISARGRCVINIWWP